MLEKFLSKRETEKESVEIDPKFIKQIEALNLDVDTKEEILLVVANEKPAAWINFDASMWHEGESPHVLKTENDIENFYEVIKKSGLHFKILPRKITTEKQKIKGEKIEVYRDKIEVLIANSDEKLKTLSKILENKTLDHELLGRALGIPETAIEAFIEKRQRLNLYKLPKEILLSDAFLFAPTRTFSEDNWEHEIIEGQKIADILKNVSPQIYNEKQKSTLRANEQQGLLSDEVRAKWSRKTL